MSKKHLSAKKALKKLKEGNKRFIDAKTNSGDVSKKIRLKTAKKGQFPYAVVISCSDSRAVPEHIFDVGMGEIFTIRVAGNVIDNHQLGSIEYAVSHLGASLVVVMGHTNCGAVGAAIAGGGHGYVSTITDEIKVKIGSEDNDYKASCMNVNGSVAQIRYALAKAFDESKTKVKVKGCIYKLDTGKVKWID